MEIPHHGAYFTSLVVRHGNRGRVSQLGSFKVSQVRLLKRYRQDFLATLAQIQATLNGLDKE